MCDECQFLGGCTVRDEVCREILLSGDHKDMQARVTWMLSGCTLFLIRESRRYA